MARYLATVSSPRVPEDVFAFMADLRNFSTWDPSVRGVEQIAGDGGGAAAVFDVTVRTGRRDMTLRYRTETYRPPRTLVIVAQTWMLRSEDRIDVQATGAGSSLTYDARLDLRGPLSIADRLLQRTFHATASRAAAGLREQLGERAVDG